MDLGSIEDLLRPASLVERKKRLGLLDGAPTKKLAPTTITDTRLSLKDNSTSPQHKHRGLSPNLKKSKSASSDRKDKSQTFPSRSHNKKRRKMENRPPLAPKPDSIPPPPPPSGGAPVAKPRRKPGGPPPAKPMPYRKHVELKDKEVTTFKSSNPVAPPRIRQRPAPPTKPPPASYRLSTPGEPSELYQPKAESKAPVQYAIPVVPKPPNKPIPAAIIDRRPRLDTPQVVPDPSKVLAVSNSPPQADSKQNNINGVSRDPSGGEQPELYAEAYAEVDAEEDDAEYAVVSPTRKAVVPSAAAVRPPPPVVPLTARPPPPVVPSTAVVRPPPPKVPSPSHKPIPVRRPTPPIASPLHHRSPSPTPITTPSPPSSTRDEVDNHEYNVTSHVKEAVRKRSNNTPPIPPPHPSSSRPPRPQRTSQSAVKPSPGTEEYSVLDRPDKKQKVAPVAQGLDEYSVLSDKKETVMQPEVEGGDEYSVISEEPLPYPTAQDGYGQLDLQSMTSSVENTADSAVYEEVKSDDPVGSNGDEKDSAPPPVLKKHPKAIARRASDKFKDEGMETTVLSSRDRSKLPSYRHDNNSFDGEVSTSRLPPRTRPPPPVPHPKRQKKMQNDNNTTSIITSDAVEDTRGSHKVSNEVLEEAGYETVNTFSPPPEDMETEASKGKKSPPPTKPKKSPLTPPKTKGGKPPPLPKPKQIPPAATSREKRGSTENLVDEGGMTSSSKESLDSERIYVSSGHVPVPQSNQRVEDVDSEIHTVVSPKIELDIDHIMQVGSALMKQGVEEKESLYTNQSIVEAMNPESVSSVPRPSSGVSDGAASSNGSMTDLASQKRGSKSSGYENQLVIDAVQADGMEEECAQQKDGEDKMDVDGLGDEDSQVAMDESVPCGDKEPTCTALSPSEIFTVPQHAVPGHLGYCDIGVSKTEDGERMHFEFSSQTEHAAPEMEGDDNETFTVKPHSYPDPHGYCDIEIQEPPPANVAGNGVVEENAVADVRGSDVQHPSTTEVTDAQGYCDIDIKTPPTRSHEYEVVPETTKQKMLSSAPPGMAPPPRRKMSSKSHDQDGGSKVSGDTPKGTPPKRPPPRRRAPPPPPAKSKTVEEQTPNSSPAKKELVLSTGLATLPRSPRKQAPKPPPPFSSGNSPLLSRKKSPRVGKKLDTKLPPLPMTSPLSSPLPPGSPKDWDTTESPQSGGGIKKKFKGFFKGKQSSDKASDGGSGANSNNPGGFGRRASWRKKKGAPPLQDVEAQLSSSAKAKSLPGHARLQTQPVQPLQFQISYDADQEDDDEFGIYSTINENKLKQPMSAGPTTAASTAMHIPVTFDEAGDEKDESGYDVVDKKQRSVSVSKKKKKKSGKKGFDMRKASSVEHLYESADFEEDTGMPKSADNTPKIPRKSHKDDAPQDNPVPPQPNRNILAGPPNLDELKEGFDANQLYAQVVASPKQPPKLNANDKQDGGDSIEINGEDQTIGKTGQTGIDVSAGASSTQDMVGDVDRSGEVETERLVVTSLDERFGRVVSPEREVINEPEIEHTMEGDDAYAVVPVKMKKAAAKKRKSTKESKDEAPPTVLPSSNGNVGRGVSKPPGKVPPPKPPKSYREHVATSSVSPQRPTTPVKLTDTQESKTVSENQSNPIPGSPGFLNSPLPRLDVSLGLDISQEIRTRVASFSSGPPSFPPPPPPKSASPENIQESPEEETGETPYNTIELTPKKPKRKAPPKPPPPRFQNGAVGNDEGGYEAVKNNKRTPGRNKKESSGQAKNKAGLVHIDKVSKPHLSPSQRSPHVYATFEDVQDELGELKSRESSVSLPVKTPAVGYATVPHKRHGSLPQSAKGTRSPKLAKHPKLSPKARPPPAPPGQQRSRTSEAAQTDPTAEDQIGKRIFVSMENSPTPEAAGPEPKFLFSHAQKFIVVGDAENTPQMSNSYEEESDGDLLDSTDWETSSGEEDAEEESRPQTPEPKEVRPKMFYIAREILTTERTFVKGLTLIDKDFRQAMRSANNAHEKPVITEEALKVILGNVSSLLTLNSGLLQELEERMTDWSTNVCIGDILLSRAPYLKLYTEYISKFDKALKMLEEHTKKNPIFAQVLKEFESQPKCANLPLAGYMLDIVQRITRYKLLLADYVKHLPDDSPDKDASQKALVIISSVATHVNETVRQMDNFRKVCDVRKKLIGDSGDTLITPHRKLMKEGELMKFSRKEKQPRMFFLFNDILIYASSIPPANTTFKVIKRIPLEGMKVELLDDPEMRYGFQIVSTCKSFRLEASNREELHQWMTTFENAIKDLSDRKKTAEQSVEETDSSIPLGNLAPPWLPDSAVSMCQLCSAHFTVTRRRHHCRACGKIFCSECSSYLAPLKYKNNKLGRVCQMCYEKLPKNDDTLSAKRTTSLQRGSKSRVSLPSVLREVKARDQSAQISGYLLSRSAKSRKWKKRWFVVFNLVLYEFERHEDVSAKRSITLPSYQVVKHDSDPLVFVLNHPGTGKEYFKEDSPEQLEKWIEVLQKAVLGQIEEEEEPLEEGVKEEAEEDDEEETADESSPSHQAPPFDTPSDTASDATQSPSKESSHELPHPIVEEDDRSSLS